MGPPGWEVHIRLFRDLRSRAMLYNVSGPPPHHPAAPAKSPKTSLLGLHSRESRHAYRSFIHYGLHGQGEQRVTGDPVLCVTAKKDSKKRASVTQIMIHPCTGRLSHQWNKYLPTWKPIHNVFIFNTKLQSDVSMITHTHAHTRTRRKTPPGCQEQ